MHSIKRIASNKITPILASWVGYMLVFDPLYRTLGLTVTALGLIPVILSGWRFGMIGGAVAGLFSFPLNLLLLRLAKGTAGDMMDPGSLVGSAILVMAGAIFGRLHNLSKQVKEELTMREQAEGALQESEERYRMLIQAQGEGSVMLDAQQTFTLANPAAQDILGVPGEELVGRSLQEFVDSETFARIRRQLTSQHMGEGGTHELNIQRPDGEQRSLLVTTTPKFDAQERFIGTLSVFRDITKRKQAEETLQKRATHLALLNEISKKITAELELSSVLERAAHLVQESFGYHHTALFTLDAEKKEIVMQAIAGDFVDLFPPNYRQKLNEGFIGWVGQHGQPLLSNNVDEEPRYVNSYPNLVPTRSELSVPIQVGDKTMGVLDVQSPKLGAFDDNDMRVLETLAGQIAVAIENAQLYEAMEQELDEHKQAEESLHHRHLELITLNIVSQALASSLELQEILDKALSSTIEMLGVTGGIIAINNERTEGLTIASHIGLPASLVKKLKADHINSGFCNLICQRGMPLKLEDLRDEAPAEVEELLKMGLQSCISTPIVYKDRVLGALCTFDTSPYAVSESTLALLVTIGQQIGVAVENARLFERAIRDREVANTLLDTAESLSTILKFDKLLERVLDELHRLVPYQSAALYLLHELHEERCQTAAIRGPKELSPADKWFNLEKSPSIEQVVQERSPTIITNTEGEPDHPEDSIVGSPPSWIGVPLISRNKVIGVLTAETDQPNAYNDETARLAYAFTHQAALAIENSRLYGQTRSQLREVTVLQGVTAAISSTLNMNQILPYVARSLCEIMNGTSVEIYSLDQETNTATVVANYITSQATQTENTSLGHHRPLNNLPGIEKALTRHRPLQVQSDAPDVAPSLQAQLEARDAQAMLVLPMVTRDRVVGFAQIWDSTGPHHFTSGEIATGQTLTHQTAIAMENARLLRETQERAREMALLHDVALAAASGMRLEETLQAAVRALADNLQGNHVMVLLLDPEADALHVQAQVGYPSDQAEELEISLGEGIIGWVAQQGSPALVPDVHQDSRYIEVAPDVRSKLCVPLITGSEVIGVLNVESPQPNTFTNDDLQLLNTLSGNLTMMISNARLFEEIEAARTELQRRAEALEKANERLQELDHLKSQFLANMSHELRTPLNSIIGFSEVLHDGLVGDLTSEQQECVENIYVSGEHLLALINDVLDLSKIEAGRVELSPSTFRVGDLIDKVHATIISMVEEKSQTLHIELIDGLPPLTADRLRIKQVLLNLLSNAHKFTPEGGEITIACELFDSHTMLFSVSDTGIGIRKEDQEAVFEEFHQVDGSATRKVEGTGLGLAISKQLVEMHGGRIWVESDYGEGATFFFLLPISRRIEKEAETSKTRGSKTTRQFIGKTALIVDENRRFNNLLAFHLQREGYEPIQRYQGAGTLEQVQELKPSLITLDVMLSQHDGWQILQALKSDPQTKDIPVLVISALGNSDLALSLGAEACLSKPLKQKDLRSVLSQLTETELSPQERSVLIVDDDPEFVYMVQEMLQSEDYTPLGAFTGEDALALARQERPDMMLLDLLMPEMNGFDVIQKLRTDFETQNIPVIVVTAKKVTEKDHQLLNDQVQGLINKRGLTPQVLLQEVHRTEKILQGQSSR